MVIVAMINLYITLCLFTLNRLCIECLVLIILKLSVIYLFLFFTK